MVNNPRSSISEELKNQFFCILIVDDSRSASEFLKVHLKSVGYKVATAEDGETAISKAEYIHPDLILLDVHMPGISGIETCIKLKERIITQDIPVMFISSLKKTFDMVKGFDAGGVDYITKPFDIAEVLARIKTHLTLHSMKIQLEAANLQYQTVQNKLKTLNLELESRIQVRTQDLENAHKELKVLDQSKSEFLSIISHEIRTPLNGILGMVNLFKMKSKDHAELDHLDTLDQSCRRLEQFSLKALEIAQLNSKGEKLLNLQEYQIHMVLKGLIIKLASDIEKKNLKVINEILPCEFNADKKYFTDCIEIILKNAIQHSSEGETVLISSKKIKAGYIFSIKDGGKGFPETLIKNGIKAFASQKHFNLNPGLDLYLCKLIIAAHGGKISLTNNGGGIVQIFLPHCVK